MALWQVRSIKLKDQESLMLDHNIVFIGWELPDLSNINTFDELSLVCRDSFPDAKETTLSNWTKQIWTFRARMQIDDIVIVPLRSNSNIAVGEIMSDYEYRSDLTLYCCHSRRVRWIHTDVNRRILDGDLRSSLGSILTVCQIQRNDAETRFKEIITRLYQV